MPASAPTRLLLRGRSDIDALGKDAGVESGRHDHSNGLVLDFADLDIVLLLLGVPPAFEASGLRGVANSLRCPR